MVTSHPTVATTLVQASGTTCLDSLLIPHFNYTYIFLCGGVQVVYLGGDPRRHHRRWGNEIGMVRNVENSLPPCFEGSRFQVTSVGQGNNQYLQTLRGAQGRWLEGEETG